MKLKILVIPLIVASSLPAFGAWNDIKQEGSITNGNIPIWFANKKITDSGTSASDLTNAIAAIDNLETPSVVQGSITNLSVDGVMTLDTGTNADSVVLFSVLEGATNSLNTATQYAVVNVKEPPYSAVGDGIADDTAALQAAFNYVSSNATAALYIPAGTYNITNELVYTPSIRSGKIYGDGSERTIISQQTASENGIRLQWTDANIDWLTIEGLQIEGVGSVTSTGIGLSIPNSTYWADFLKLSDMRISGFDVGLKGIGMAICVFERLRGSENNTGLFLDGEAGSTINAVSLMTCSFSSNSETNIFIGAGVVNLIGLDSAFDGDGFSIEIEAVNAVNLIGGNIEIRSASSRAVSIATAGVLNITGLKVLCENSPTNTPFYVSGGARASIRGSVISGLTTGVSGIKVGASTSTESDFVSYNAASYGTQHILYSNSAIEPIQNNKFNKLTYNQTVTPTAYNRGMVSYIVGTGGGSQDDIVVVKQDKGDSTVFSKSSLINDRGFFGADLTSQPAANADTSGATLGDLETEVNQLKAVLRTWGLIDS